MLILSLTSIWPFHVGNTMIIAEHSQRTTGVPQRKADFIQNCLGKD